MRARLTITLLLACLTAASERFTLVAYNCENFYDTRHDTLKDDHEFLPQGQRRWTAARFRKKAEDISRVIVACGGEGEEWQLPDAVLLVEVENDNVMRQLTRYGALRTAGYKYLITDSPDPRGIDIALLYNPLSVRLIAHDTLRVTPPLGQRPTRDILHAALLTTGKDTLHLFGVHAPSRRGGRKATENYRIAVIRRVMEAVARIRQRTPDARIIVAGDFNDYSDDLPLRTLVAAELKEVSLNARGRNNDYAVGGTYRFQGEWKSLDHIFVSAPLLPRVAGCSVFDAPWILERNKVGAYKPFRTYNGPAYHGGVSDHLPLILTLR